MKRLIQETVEQRLFGMSYPGHEGRIQRLEKLPVSSAEVAHLEFFGSPLSLVAGGQGNVAWTTFETTDQDAFGTNLLGIGAAIRNITGDTTLVLSGAGLYLAIGSAIWDSGAYPYITFVDVLISDADLTAAAAHPTIEALTTNTFAGTAGKLMPYSIQAAWVNPGDQAALRLAVQNSDTNSRSVQSALLSVFYWQNSGTLSSVF